MKSIFHVAAVSLLTAGSAFAQSATPPCKTVDSAERAGLGAAGNEQLLDQRAAGASLAAPVSEADRATLSEEAARHGEYADMRGDVDVSDHDIGVAVVAAAVVILLIWIF